MMPPHGAVQWDSLDTLLRAHMQASYSTGTLPEMMIRLLVGLYDTGTLDLAQLETITGINDLERVAEEHFR